MCKALSRLYMFDVSFHWKLKPRRKEGNKVVKVAFAVTVTIMVTITVTITVTIFFLHIR